MQDQAKKDGFWHDKKPFSNENEDEENSHEVTIPVAEKEDEENIDDEEIVVETPELQPTPGRPKAKKGNHNTIEAMV